MLTLDVYNRAARALGLAEEFPEGDAGWIGFAADPDDPLTRACIAVSDEFAATFRARYPQHAHAVDAIRADADAALVASRRMVGRLARA